MNITNYPLKRGQWYEEATKKQFVVWHGSEGRTRNTPASGRPGRATTSIDASNFDALRVGAPYLVDRDGTIFKTFDDADVDLSPWSEWDKGPLRSLRRRDRVRERRAAH